MTATCASLSSQRRQLQVRDNEQRTRFILVWANADDGHAELASPRSFRTIRAAIAEGIARFGLLPVRRKVTVSGAAQPVRS
jgi:hypothetical protein